MNAKKFVCLLLAALMVTMAFASCADTGDGTESGTSARSSSRSTARSSS